MKSFVSLLVLGALAGSGPAQAVAPGFSDQTTQNVQSVIRIAEFKEVLNA